VEGVAMTYMFDGKQYVAVAAWVEYHRFGNSGIGGQEVYGVVGLLSLTVGQMVCQIGLSFFLFALAYLEVLHSHKNKWR